MEYSVVAEIPFSELADRLQRVPLLEYQEILPYTNSRINLESIDTDDLKPMQRMQPQHGRFEEAAVECGRNGLFRRRRKVRFDGSD